MPPSRHPFEGGAAAARALAPLAALVVLCAPVRAANRAPAPGRAARAGASDPAATGARQTIRLATLLPEGTAWMKELKRFARAVQRRTGGRARLVFYPGAMMGDERDAVAKMRRGRLQGAALTGSGVGRILPAVRVLELPYLFDEVAELYAVRGALERSFREQLRQRGFVLICWGDVGWIRYFSRQPIVHRADIARRTMWTWIDDPLARATAEQLGVKAVPLAVQAVLPSLQSGLIDTVYGTAFTTIALQWHPHLSYYSDLRVTHAIGALLLTREAHRKLTPGQQQILAEEGKKLQHRLAQRVQRDNQRALQQLRGLGLRLVRVSPELRALLVRRCRRVWTAMVGRLYSRDLLDQVLAIRDRHRKK